MINSKKKGLKVMRLTVNPSIIWRYCFVQLIFAIIFTFSSISLAEHYSKIEDNECYDVSLCFKTYQYDAANQFKKNKRFFGNRVFQFSNCNYDCSNCSYDNFLLPKNTFATRGGGSEPLEWVGHFPNLNFLKSLLYP